jgi:integrase
MSRIQRGFLSIKQYAKGATWVYRWNTTRAFDAKRVEQSRAIGLVRDIGRGEKAAWVEVERLGLSNLAKLPTAVSTFDVLAEHYIEYELQRKDGVIGRKARETAARDLHNLRAHIIPRWGAEVATDVSPLDVEMWFETLASTLCGKRGKQKVRLSWTAISKIKSVMNQVYRHAQRHGLIPRNADDNPMTHARCKSGVARDTVTVSPQQMIGILHYLDTPETQLEWTLALTCAATGLRGEEVFGLQWHDIDYVGNRILIRRAWSKGRVTDGKNVHSMSSVALHPVLAGFLQEWRRQTAYAKDLDWMFASDKRHGRIPRCASIVARDYLRPAGVEAGVLPKGDTSTRFAWHSLRHSLAEFFADNGVDPAVTMKTLRHKKLSTTLEIYTHHVQNSQIAAQGKFLRAIKVATEVVQ